MKIISQYFFNIGQTLFIGSAYFGACLLLLLCIFDPWLCISGIFSSLIGYIYTLRFSTPKLLKECGLITINCFFFGMALAFLFPLSPLFIFCLILGSMGIPLLAKASFEVLQHWKLNPSLFPYILMVWLFALAGKKGTMQLQAQGYEQVLSLYLPERGFFLEPLMRIGMATCQAMGKLFFISNPFFGFCLFLLLSLFSPRRGFYFLFGTLTATAVAFVFSSGASSWEYGAYSYCAGLIGMALASFPENFRWTTIFAFCFLASVLALAMEQVFTGSVLPALSLAYVLAYWVALLSRIPRVSMGWAESRMRGA